MGAPLAAAVTPIFTFPNTFIENLHVLPNGHILLTTLDSTGLLYTLDPAAEQPQAKQVASATSFHGATGVTGIVPLDSDGDIYAVSGGVHTSYAFERGSLHLYIVSLAKGAVIDSIPLPDALTMNGMAGLPGDPKTLLSADSITGCIWRIDTRTRGVSIAVEDAALGPGSSSSSLRVGINGLRARGNHLYFTNSNLGTFGRIPIDSGGNQVGDIEILARSSSPREIYDDFTFDREGNAYVAIHSTAVAKITPTGLQTVFAGGGEDSAFKEPTSAALANDGKSIYVSTGGSRTGHDADGGKIIRVSL